MIVECAWCGARSGAGAEVSHTICQPCLDEQYPEPFDAGDGDVVHERMTP